MQTHATSEMARDEGTALSSRLRSLLRTDAGLLLLLLLAASGLRGWQLSHTEVTSSDSIAFIRIAWDLQHHPWPEVFRGADRHPGYPLTIAAASMPVRALVSGPDTATMQLSAQLACAAASLLLILPMYYLGRELFDRTTAFGACLLFQFLPSSSRVLGDGLSEGVYLVCAVTALLLATRGLRSGSVLRFILCGVCGGLAYLTRPEGLLVVAATGLVLLAAQAVPAWRRSCGRLVACGLGLTVAAGVVAGPYFLVTNRLTVKPTANAFRAVVAQSEARPVDAPPPSAAVPLLAVVWEGKGNPGWKWGLTAVAGSIGKGYFYVAWIPGLLGLWWFRRRFRQVPGTWVLAIVCGVLTLLLWRVAVVFGYVTDRHLLLLTLCGCFWVAAGLRELPHRLTGVVPYLPTRFRESCRRVIESRRTPTVVLVLLVAAMLPKNLAPLNADKVGFRAAGIWLAGHAGPEDGVIDPYGWPSYFAGRMLVDAPTDPSPGTTRYVVLQYPTSEHSLRPRMPEALALAAQGREVYQIRTPARRGRFTEVIVYAVPTP